MNKTLVDEENAIGSVENNPNVPRHFCNYICEHQKQFVVFYAQK